MRKIITMAALAALMSAPAFATPNFTPSPETITGGSSSSVSSVPKGALENAYAGSSSNIGIQNSTFTAYNTDTAHTAISPIDGNGTTYHDVSVTNTTTTGTASLESGGTQSFGGEAGGASFNASGYEYGTVSVDPNAGFPPVDHNHGPS